MRRRIMSVISVSAMLAVVGASAAGASGGAGSVSHNRPAKVGPFAPNLTILWNQTTNDSGVGIVSQNFTDAGFDIYDSQGADDFVVPSGHTWTVKGMRFIGVYFGCVTCGPADNETITIYKDAGGTPGVQLGSGTVTAVDNAGTFTATLPNIHLNAGTYWVSVQATMNYAAGGEWAWETTNTQTGSPAVWKNPGNGFGTGCTAYANMQTCIGPSGEGPDFMFAIAGSTT